MTRQGVFTVGGTVQAGGGTYVPRQVDEVLLRHCRDGRFAFVLSARQMGKSSLMVHTAECLRAEGAHTLIIDLSQIGVQATPDAWYLSLITRAEDGLHLRTDAYDWWIGHSHLTYANRLTKFFEEVLLEEIEGPVVVFVDEIDSTLNLSFTDDFFAAVRFVHNARSVKPIFGRLSFVLVGVATPNDLITDPSRTPFNIGEAVDVDYFTHDEAMFLAEGFDFPEARSAEVIDRILYWTSGHPYLTQRLCAIIADQDPSRVSRSDVDAAVADTFLGEKGQQDSNLRFVQDMLTRWATDETQVLVTYGAILDGRKVPDDRQSLVATHLKLSGVVRREGDYLRLSNRIYGSVFDRAWMKRQRPEHWIRRVPAPVLGLVAASFTAVVLLALFLLQTQKREQAEMQSVLQEHMNDELRAQVVLSDSLGAAADAANEQLSESNEKLSHEILLSDSLRQVTEVINEQLAAQAEMSDSLRRIAEAVNGRLVSQVLLADSLRETAFRRLDETRAARLETITIALANKAQRQLRLGDPLLGAMLARQAYLFHLEGGHEFLDAVYDALMASLNILPSPRSDQAGGPLRLADFDVGIRAVAYSRDGRWLASGDSDARIWLKDLTTNAATFLNAHEAAVRTLAFSPDSRTLASGGDDGTVRMWSLPDDGWPEQQLVERRSGGVWTVEYAPSGKYLVSAGSDGTVVVWALENDLPRRAASLHLETRIRVTAFSPDDATIFAAGDDGQLRAWHWRHGAGSAEVWGLGEAAIHSLALDRTGTLMAVGGVDPLLAIWQMGPSGMAPRLLRVLDGHEGPVYTVTFDSSGEYLGSGGADNSVQLWDTEHLDRSPLLLQGHSFWVRALAFSPDGQALVSGGADGRLRLWNVSPERLAETICRRVQGREVSPDEWSQFVGDDFPYAEHYRSCSTPDQVSESRSKHL